MAFLEFGIETAYRSVQIFDQLKLMLIGWKRFVGYLFGERATARRFGPRSVRPRGFHLMSSLTGLRLGCKSNRLQHSVTPCEPDAP